MERKYIAVISILSFILGFALSLFFAINFQSPKKLELSEKIVSRDTIVRLIPSKPIIINKVKTRLIKISDTVIKAFPFEARLDTIIRYDTIRASYEFPRHLFSLEVRKTPDSLRFQTVTITKTIEKEKPWWETPVYIVGGTLVGYLIGAAGR